MGYSRVTGENSSTVARGSKDKTTPRRTPRESWKEVSDVDVDREGCLVGFRQVEGITGTIHSPTERTSIDEYDALIP